MIATKKHVIPVTQAEMVWLVHNCKGGAHFAFGTGGAAVVWEEGEAMPEDVRQLLTKRGVLNENMEGAGI